MYQVPASKLSKAREDMWIDVFPPAWTNQRRPWRVCSGAKGDVAAPAKRRLTQLRPAGKKKEEGEKKLSDRRGGRISRLPPRESCETALEHMQILVDASRIR